MPGTSKAATAQGCCWGTIGDMIGSFSQVAMLFDRLVEVILDRDSRIKTSRSAHVVCGTDRLSISEISTHTHLQTVILTSNVEESEYIKTVEESQVDRVVDM